MPVLFRQGEYWDKNGIVETSNGFFFQVGFRNVSCLVLIERQKALIEVSFQGKNRLVAKHNLKEIQLGHIPAHQDQAHRERGRQNQTHRAP